MNRQLVFLIILIAPFTHYGQVLMNKDSLLKLLPNAKADTNAVQLYINLGQQFETNEPETAKSYYRKAGNLSRRLSYPKGVVQYINNYTFVLNMQGQYDSSLMLNLQAVAIAKDIKDSLMLAKTLFNTGSSYKMLEEYEHAVTDYMEGSKLFEKYGNEVTLARANEILQQLYFKMKNYQKAIELGEKSLAVFRRLNDSVWLGNALNNLGVSYSAVMKFDRSMALFTEALEIAKKIKDKNLLGSLYLNLGDVALQQGDFEKLKFYMDNALTLSKEMSLAENEVIATKGLSFYYTFKKDYRLADQYGKEALRLSYQYDFKSQRSKIFASLSNISYARQNILMGEYYATQSTLLLDSLLNESIQKNTQELEKRYETKKKEALISTLENDREVQRLLIQKKNILNYGLIAGAFTLLLIVALSYRNYKQQQKLQQQRINELETEKQLTATEAVLKGEEQERTRLAKDLHDGLGGMLAGIKYTFNSMKENFVLTQVNQQAFERGVDMLDSAIKEMRRVAHNMMPEGLLRFGLDTALKDFCNDISQSGALQISYQSMGLANEQIDQTIAVTLYRIVQELISNTLKHAGATTAIVQVTKTGDHLAVTVEDDGKGFDPAVLRQSKGIGWANIQHRVDFLKGKLDVNSHQKKGTSIHIEFALT